MKANEILNLRKGLGLTQEAFAEALGTHRVTVARWETDGSKPDGAASKNLRELAGGRRAKRPVSVVASVTELHHYCNEHVTFLRNLGGEITRRRKENHDERIKRKWNPADVLKVEQRALLDWIEEQLERVPSCVVTNATTGKGKH